MRNDQTIIDNLNNGTLYFDKESGELFQRKYIKLKSFITKSGYRVYRPYLNGKRRQFTYHRLSYLADKKEINGCMAIDHINNNKLDNSIENLQLILPGDNTAKAHYELKMRKLAIVKICGNKKTYYKSCAEAAKNTGFPVMSIWRAAKQGKKYKGFQWKIKSADLDQEESTS